MLLDVSACVPCGLIPVGMDAFVGTGSGEQESPFANTPDSSGRKIRPTARPLNARQEEGTRFQKTYQFLEPSVLAGLIQMSEDRAGSDQIKLEIREWKRRLCRIGPDYDTRNVARAPLDGAFIHVRSEPTNARPMPDRFEQEAHSRIQSPVQCSHCPWIRPLAGVQTQCLPLFASHPQRTGRHRFPRPR